jgi:hypothetical protein
MKYTFYVIFHKILYEECYEKIDNSNIKFIGVNSKITKTIPKSLKDKVTLERELPYYNPLWQHSNFCEDSVFLHVLKNRNLLLDPYDYIGFFQYDMILNQELIDCFKSNTSPNKVFYIFKENSFRHLNQVIGLEGWTVILKIYNTIFQKDFTMTQIIMNEIPLYHTFIFHKDIFVKMMNFFEICMPLIFEMLGCETKHLPYHLERCHGIFLMLEQLQGNIEFIKMPGVIHNDNLKDGWQKV